jgi:hypothetical protein
MVLRIESMIIFETFLLMTCANLPLMVPVVRDRHRIRSAPYDRLDSILPTLACGGRSVTIVSNLPDGSGRPGITPPAIGGRTKWSDKWSLIGKVLSELVADFSSDFKEA